MIEHLRISQAPCYRPEGAVLGPLRPVNFIFGGNGAGKTTISRAFANTIPGNAEITWRRGSGSFAIKVYNRDYVERTFAQDAELAGVFRLGEDSKELQTQIEDLSQRISQRKNVLQQLRITLDGQKEKLAGLDKTLSASLWSEKGKIPAALQPMFRGFNGSQKVLLEHALEIYQLAPRAVPSEAELLEEAKGAFDDSATEQPNIRLLAQFVPAETKDAELIGTSIVGTGSVSIARLIEVLHNSDWVSQGRSYHDQTEGICPFCQQRTTDEFTRELTAYFDTEYRQQTDRLSVAAQKLEAQMDQIEDGLKAIEQNPPAQLVLAGFEVGATRLRSEITRVKACLEEKRKAPAKVFDVASLAIDLGPINRVLTSANVQISAHNDRIRNRKNAHVALVEKCWQYFVHDLTKAELASHSKASSQIRKAMPALDSKVIANQNELKGEELELQKLERSVTSSKPVIEDINNLLRSVGFVNFQLKEAQALKDGYRLVRPDGSAINGSLSEGERSFISFLYFFHELRGATTDGGTPRQTVAVIDDPISSLDSDVLFVVSTLVRQIAADIHQGRGDVRQLVTLTHNVHFHKEITFIRNRESSAHRAYFLVRKQHGGPSEIEQHTTNPVRTAYTRLWEEIGRFRAHETEHSIGLQNIMRRILENYFRILGGHGDEEIIDKFTGAERTVAKALFSWVNEGSHSIIDEMDYSPTEHTNQVYLDVFERIFTLMNHQGHYEMMMPPVPQQTDGVQTVTMAVAS